jgi:hypothetical protein
MLRILLAVAIALMATKSVAQTSDYTGRIAKLQSYGYTVDLSDHHKVNCVQGGKGYAYYKFYRGYSYIIVGSSDDYSVTDVDLYVYDTDGTTIVEHDADHSHLAVVSFTPRYDVILKVVIENYKSSTPKYASACRFVVAAKRN